MSTPERTYKTRAIVLRARNLGEADKIYTLFTQERGKIDAVGSYVHRRHRLEVWIGAEHLGVDRVVQQ